MLSFWSAPLISVVGGVFGMSKEHQRFLSINRCRQCDAVLRNALGIFTANFYAADGKRLTQWSGGPVRADIAACPKCGHRWRIYGASSLAPQSKIEALEVIETDRTEEFFGEDRRIIDNSKSSAQLTRNFSFSKEWSKSCHLEVEKAQGEGAELVVGAKDAAGIKLSAEEKVRQIYSISRDAKETCTEEVTCRVEPYAKVTIVVRWKRIWQLGFVDARQDGAPLRIPFQIAVGMTFDQQQIEEKDASAEQ
jgi:hypothetical protein